MDQFAERRVPGLFYRADNLRCPAGHVRLFGDRPGKGWTVYLYGEQAPGWAMHRRWNFGLFCIHHVGEGKATDPAGWHVTFAGIRFKREYRGFSVHWQWADTFRTRKLP